MLLYNLWKDRIHQTVHKIALSYQTQLSLSCGMGGHMVWTEKGMAVVGRWSLGEVYNYVVVQFLNWLNFISKLVQY